MHCRVGYIGRLKTEDTPYIVLKVQENGRAITIASALRSHDWRIINYKSHKKYADDEGWSLRELHKASNLELALFGITL